MTDESGEGVRRRLYVADRKNPGIYAGIIIFAVVSAFCMHLLPDKKYQKYARFVIGLVYICMILSVMGEIMGKTVSEIHF